MLTQTRPWLVIPFLTTFVAISAPTSWADDHDLMCESQFQRASHPVVQEFGKQLREGQTLTYSPSAMMQLDADSRADHLAARVADLAQSSKRWRHHTKYLVSAFTLYARQATEIEYYLTSRLIDFFLEQRRLSTDESLSPVASQWLDLWVRGKLNTTTWLWTRGVRAGFINLLFFNACAGLSNVIATSHSPQVTGAVHFGASIGALVSTAASLWGSYFGTHATRHLNQSEPWLPFYPSDVGEHWNYLDSDLGPTGPDTTVEDLYFFGRQYSKFAHEQLALSDGTIDVSLAIFSTPLHSIQYDAQGEAQRLGLATHAFFRLLNENTAVFELAIKRSFGPKLTPEIARAIDQQFGTKLEAK